MLISPPFLPDRGNKDETTFLDAAMNGSELGLFPVSQKLSWHGGRHLLAPKDTNGAALSVRVIADGTVVFVRPRTSTDSSSHPLRYGGGYTSDSVVVIRHDTAIGVDTRDAPVTVRFYSVYMHLHVIESTIRIGRAIHRKDPIGQAGHIYGEPNLIHFEICCDPDNLARLIGRSVGNVLLGHDGRTDAIYGDMHFRLPAGTPVYASQPLLDSSSVPPTVRILTRSNEDWFIGLRYAFGNAILTTRDADGRELSCAHNESNYGEYRLYERAQALSQAVRQANIAAQRASDPVPSPSACYELLRFGRVIGADTLIPKTTPHWRQINTVMGSGWVNLNADGVTKYSDADFPHWRGWMLIDDSTDHNSRCDSSMIRRLLDGNSDGIINAKEIESQLSIYEIRQRLFRTICRFPSEWDAATIDARWSWLRVSTPKNPRPFSDRDWDEFKAHAQALCFDCPELFSAQWCFDPRTFIEHFKKCGWMSSRDMAQVLPRKTKAYGPFELTWIAANRRLEEGHPLQPTSRPLTMPAGMHLALNKTFRKYGLTTPLRQAHFFGQIFQETGVLTLNTESGSERYFRTMYEAITAQEAGEDYDNRSSVAWRLGLVYHRVNGQHILMTREQYLVKRPQQVREKSAELGNIQAGDGPRFKGRGVIQLTGRANYARYGNYRGRDYTTGGNQISLATDALVSIDVSAFYWVSKVLPRRKGLNINYYADAGSTDEDVRQVTKAINGGETHLSERQEYFRYVWGLLQDAPTPADTEKLKRQTLPREFL